MRFRKTNSTLTNLERGEDISLYDVIGLFQDICDDLEEENDTMLDELNLGDADKAVGRLLWVGQEITSVLRSHKKTLVDPGRAAKLQKQEEKLASETELLAGTEAELVQYIQKEKALLQIQEKRRLADQQKVELREKCERLERENSLNESVTIPELQEKKRILEEKQSELLHARRTCEEESIRLKIANEEAKTNLQKAKIEYEETSTLYEKLNSELKELENKKFDYQKKNQHIREMLGGIERELQRLEYDNVQLESVAIPELQEKKEVLLKQKIELTDEYEVSQKEHDLRYEQAQSLIKSVNELLQQNMYLAQTIKDRQQQVEGFEVLKKEKLTDIELLEAQLQKQEEQLGDLDSEKNILIRKITELTGNIEEHNIHNLRKRFDDYQAEYQELEAECQRLQIQYDEMLNSGERKELEKEALEECIVDTGRKLTEQEEKILRLSGEKQEVLCVLEEKSRQRQELEGWFDGLECKDFKERINKIQKRIHTLKEVQKSLIKDLDDRLYLSGVSATEQVQKISEDITLRLNEYEEKSRELQSEYVTIVKMIYEKGE